MVKWPYTYPLPPGPVYRPDGVLMGHVDEQGVFRLYIRKPVRFESLKTDGE